MNNMTKKKNKLGNWADRYLDLMDTTPKFGWVVGLLLMAVSFIPKFSHELCPDSEVYLYLASRMFDGARYYYDFFEFNTPFAIGIYTIPVALAHIFGVFMPTMAKIFNGLLILGSIGVTHVIIRRSKQWSVALKYNAIIIALFFSLNFLSTITYNELTTKTIVFLCFILPYFFSIQLLLENAAISRRLQITIGLFLGLAVCLKPHYAVFPAIMEIYLVLKQRKFSVMFRWSNMLAGMVIMIYYVAVIPLFFPGYIKEIPLFIDFYDGAQADIWDKLSEIIIYLLYLSPFLLWRMALRNQLDRMVSFGIFFPGIAASIAILFLETYLTPDQRSILNFFICLPFLYSVLVFLRQHDAPGPSMSMLSKGFATLAAMLGAVTIGGVVNIVSAYDPSPQGGELNNMEMLSYVNKYAPHEPVYTISRGGDHLMYLNLHLSKRPYPIFSYQRPLYYTESRRYAYRGQDVPEHLQNAENYFMQSFLRFFTETPPGVVFVDKYNRKETGNYCAPLLLDLLLNKSPEFKTIWEKHYKKIGSIISADEILWLEDKPSMSYQTLDFGNRKVIAAFPPKDPAHGQVGPDIDVYLRKD
jgi:hypothetical protein